MTAVTVRKEDRLPLYLGGKIIVYNAKSLNKYDEVGGKTYSRGRISIVLIICYIIFLFCCLLLCLFLNPRLFCLFFSLVHSRSFSVRKAHIISPLCQHLASMMMVVVMMMMMMTCHHDNNDHNHCGQFCRDFPAFVGNGCETKYADFFGLQVLHLGVFCLLL